MVESRAKKGFDAMMACLIWLEKRFGPSQVIGLLVGFVSGRGILLGLTSSPLFILLYPVTTVLGAIAIRLVVGSDLRRQIAVAFYVMTWMIGLLAISILGIAIATVSGSPGPVNAAILVLSLGFYLYVAWTKFQAREILGIDSVAISSKNETKASQGWFREEDLHQLSKSWLVFMAVFGGMVGFVASALLLLYAFLAYVALFPLYVPGVLASTVFLGGIGVLRNRILRHVAGRGFRATYRFRNFAFSFYFLAVLSGALGLGYGYGYVSQSSTGLVLPFAALFVLFLYLYLLWSKVFETKSEEGRLCIFEFLVEHDEDGNGYAWLKRGLDVTESMLRTFGVAVKRNSLFFGSSYSLLEGSYLEYDLDNIYRLGDWTSQTNDPKAVYEITSWFLYRSNKAEKRGFSRVFSLLDRLLELSPQSMYYIIAAVGVIVGIIIRLLLR